MNGLEPGTLDVLAGTPATLRALLAGIPEEALSAPGAEGWSARDVVAHLASIQRTANVQRVRLMIEHDNPLIPNVDEEETLAASGLRSRPTADALATFERERGEAMAMLRSLTAEDLLRRGRHQVAGDLTVADIVHHIAYHDLLHVGQVAALLAAPIEQRRGAMRMF